MALAVGTPSIKKYNKYRMIEGYKAGEAFNEGDPIYLKSTDNKWYKALNTARATVARGAASRTVTAAQVTANDATALVNCYPECEVEYGSGGTIGADLYLGNTAGLVQEAAPGNGEWLQFLGFLLSATRVKFDVKPALLKVQAAGTSQIALG